MATNNQKFYLNFHSCVIVCTDGAAATTGHHPGVIAQINAVIPDCRSTHCALHGENLAIKKMSPQFNID